MKFCNSIITLLMPLLCCLPTALRADEDFEARIYKSSDGGVLLYRIHIPKNIDVVGKYPLIVFFHGAGERGADNKKQLSAGVRKLLNYSKKNNEPVVIIAPQCPQSRQWVDTPWARTAHVMPKEPSLPMKLTLELLKDIMSRQQIDQGRIYVTGLSMGGYGTWDIIQRRPDLFAAAIPICGGGDGLAADKIKNIPIWAFHGDQDRAVPTVRSRDMIAAVRKAGGSPNYTEYKNVGHYCWDKTYGNDEVLRWLFTQTRQLKKEKKD